MSTRKRYKAIPADYEVQPLGRDKVAESPEDTCQCGYCGLRWDDGQVTGLTPAPSGRCPFEEFHIYR